MAKKKSEKSGINKKLLNKMTESAMPAERPKPRLSLYGKDAQAFFGKKPGSKVSAKIKGVVQSVGMREWNSNEPEADIRITDIKADKDTTKQDE